MVSILRIKEYPIMHIPSVLGLACMDNLDMIYDFYYNTNKEFGCSFIRLVACLGDDFFTPRGDDLTPDLYFVGILSSSIYLFCRQLCNIFSIDVSLVKFLFVLGLITVVILKNLLLSNF